MSLSSPFIRRPIGTLLLTIGLALTGIAAFFVLPVAPLPQIDFPTILVEASLAGASPESMASTIASPLERRLQTIAGVTELTSQSGLGSTRIIMQFDLSRSVDGAARDVQAAINAARADMPASLRENPTYRKVNPADSPIIILGLTSRTRTPSDVYDTVSNIVEQRLSQVQGVGQVEIGGGSLPAVRIDLNPLALAQDGISLEDVRTAIGSDSANRPKGVIEGSGTAWQVYGNMPSLHASEFAGIIVAWRNGVAVRLSDIAHVWDGPEDIRTMGLVNGHRAVTVIISRQPGANIIETVDSIKAQLPIIQAQLPADIHLEVASDRTTTIRASLHEVELTLVVATLLVVAVVSIFLRSLRATVVPFVAVVVSLLGTLGAMYLLGFSLNNLSLMALTVSTGFVVDDAIVVLENISRHVESGMDARRAALIGAREVGFTVLSISISLVAVFIPLLFMGGLVGRLFREFAVTMTVAVLISLVISLTTTPMIASQLLRHQPRPGRFGQAAERGFAWIEARYARSLDIALAHRGLTLLVLAAVIVLNLFLLGAVPKGFFPDQDTGSMIGGLRADQSISFSAMQQKLGQIVGIIRKDPAVQGVVAFTGGSRAGGGFLFVQEKPKSRRDATADVIERLRPKLQHVTGVATFLMPVQDLRVGGRSGNARYQYTLKSDDAAELQAAATKLVAALKADKRLVDVDMDAANGGASAYVDVDRDAARRLGIDAQTVDAVLYDGFGQRQVANIYSGLNQYHVVMGVQPNLLQSPASLNQVYVPANAALYATGSAATVQVVTPGNGLGTTANAAAALLGAGATSNATAGTTTGPAAGTTATGSATTQSSSASASTSGTASGVVSANSGSPTSTTGSGRDTTLGSAISTTPATMVPLSAIARWHTSSTAAEVNHQDGAPSTTITFDTAPGTSLGQAAQIIAQAEARLALPASVRGGFAGTAKVFQQSTSSTPILIISALLVIYIVLGILYESAIHPLTVLSTLPSAGIGAVLALMVFGLQFDLIGLIGVILLIGIVKKNAIMIIDFALDAERGRGLTALEAIREASILRFRPILMTTLAAGLGALPLAIGFGEGAELRRPLGFVIIGGLIASQFLTLLTTPVVYLALDRFRRRSPNEARFARAHALGEEGALT